MTLAAAYRYAPPYLQFFLYLQALDFLTTVVGIRLGMQEVSPVVRHMMSAGPVIGALLSKLAAVALAGYCLWTHRHRLIRWINYWYAVLVVWNLCIILVGLRAF
ncbi:MAG: DUF5658 family protein [Acidobacteriota bacterium]